MEGPLSGGSTLLGPWMLYSHAETVADVMSQTGVSLDQEFCVKAVRGMLGEMQKNPSRFAGKRVLFIHSGIQQPAAVGKWILLYTVHSLGGVFGLFDGRIDAVVEKSSVTNQILMEDQVFT